MGDLPLVAPYSWHAYPHPGTHKLRASAYVGGKMTRLERLLFPGVPAKAAEFRAELHTHSEA